MVRLARLLHEITRPAEPELAFEDRGDALVVRATLPGLDPASIAVEVEADVLRLSGARPAEPEGVEFLTRELPSGPVDLALRLPFRPAPDAVSARYEAGILTLELPKPAEERPRRIQVQVQAS